MEYVCPSNHEKTSLEEMEIVLTMETQQSISCLTRM